MKHQVKQSGIVVVFLLLSAVDVWAQTPQPAIEHQSLMNMRFYEATGGFLVEALELVFPPPKVENAAVIIARASGEAVGKVPLRFEPMQFPAFGLLVPDGVPGNIKVGEAGNFVMSVQLNGETISSLPFSIQQKTSGDPFKPDKKFLRDGPFRELAYFSVSSDSPKGEMQFNWWMSLRELPTTMTNPRVTLHLLANGHEIAASSNPTVPSVNDWQFLQHRQLEVPSHPKRHWLTMADLAKISGQLTLVVKANGQRIKTYQTKIQNGRPQGLPQNQLNANPHTVYISPKFIDMSSGSSSSYKMFDMFWMSKIK